MDTIRGAIENTVSISGNDRGFIIQIKRLYFSPMRDRLSY